jgi:hypothetical protein
MTDSCFAQSSLLDDKISEITDPHVQEVMKLMRAENQHHYASYCSVVQSAVSTLELSFQRHMESWRQLPPVPLAPDSLPQFIVAADGNSSQSSPKSSSCGVSLSSSMSDRLAILSQDGGSVVGLKCLFCFHYHVIEKSHYQHYDRFLTRYESGKRYGGKCCIPDNHWLFSLVGFGDSKEAIVRKFITNYLSHLHSGNEKTIDPHRAAALVAWLNSIRP